MADRIGQQFGDYRLIQLKGSGSFGDVYLGEHIHDKTQAAVKVLKTQLTSPNEIREFTNEARSLFRLQHPHIVKLLDFGIGSGDVPFLVTEYAPHGTLRQLHPKGTQLPLATVVSYVKQIASALQYAHERRLIHRDIKPENMLVGVNNEIVVSDFGIAAVAHSTLSQTPQMGLGTPYYMAPEQIQGNARPASDQYALGAVVYEWLCGIYPFKGFSYIEIAMQHLTVPPPPLRTIVPSISPAVEQVVMKALEKDPKQRFPNVVDFASALEQAYQTEISLPSCPTYMVAPTLSSGEVLDGKFKIVQVLGEGGMGRVYKVEQISRPGQFRAMKELLISPTTSVEERKTAIERFNKEINLLFGLRHPRIPSLILSFGERGTYYFVMEFVPGQSLDQMLEQNKGPLDEEQVIKWMMSICEALAYLHSRTLPVILEDMQPRDIMVTPEGEVHLIDLGTWRRPSPYMPREKRNRKAGVRLETISYRSPESLGRLSLHEREVDARSDIYSLGAIIYHLLTEDEPDPIVTPQVGSILAKNPRLHTIQVDGKIVCPIEQVIIKSMQQDPELRFQNANAMRRALEYCLSK